MAMTATAIQNQARCWRKSFMQDAAGGSIAICRVFSFQFPVVSLQSDSPRLDSEFQPKAKKRRKLVSINMQTFCGKNKYCRGGGGARQFVVSVTSRTGLDLPRFTHSMQLCSKAAKLSANRDEDFGIIRNGVESIDTEGFDG